MELGTWARSKSESQKENWKLAISSSLWRISGGSRISKRELKVWPRERGGMAKRIMNLKKRIERPTPLDVPALDAIPNLKKRIERCALKLANLSSRCMNLKKRIESLRQHHLIHIYAYNGNLKKRIESIFVFSSPRSSPFPANLKKRIESLHLMR